MRNGVAASGATPRLTQSLACSDTGSVPSLKLKLLLRLGLKCLGNWLRPTSPPLSRCFCSHKMWDGAAEPPSPPLSGSEAGTELPVENPCPELWIFTHFHYCDPHGQVATVGDLSPAAHTPKRAGGNAKSTGKPWPPQGQCHTEGSGHEDPVRHITGGLWVITCE